MAKFDQNSKILAKYPNFNPKNINKKQLNFPSKTIMTIQREGAIPIGVRHIEAIIRMAEARAKMSLRDHVSDADLDAAIAATVSSFVATQKFSFMRAMRKRFQRFLCVAADFEALLFHVLTELFREEQQFRGFLAERAAGALPERLEVERAEFEEKAKRLEIFDVEPFYRCERFLEVFGLDVKAGRIWKK